MLRAERITKRFGGLTAIDDVTITAPAGRITGLIGPNGAGKTTLFAIVAGFEPPSDGCVLFEDQDITTEATHRRTLRGIARTFQIVQPFGALTVRENIAVGAHLRHRARRDALIRAERIAERVGLGGELDKPAANLTVAGRKRLELGRALATEPKLLLLDEVLAGLNPSEIRDVLPVIRAIRDGGVTILMVEHVMQAVIHLCEHVYVLAEGRLIAEGAPAAVCQDSAVIEAYLGRGAAGRLSAPEPGHA